LQKNRVLSLLKEIVAANSENPPGHEEEVAKILREHMESYGISSITVGSDRRPNLLFSSHDDQKGRLVFHGHMDTVPVGDPANWSHDPFRSEIVDGRLYGRGASDMKGPVAALSEALIIYTEERHSAPLLMLCTSDEESGCSGAEEIARSGQLDGVQFGVCAEPTNLDVLLGEKGLFWTRVVSTGKSAHGSKPEQGVNAITACLEAIQILTAEGYPYDDDVLLGKPTINIGTIHGGVKVNVVPDFCQAELDMRIVKGQTPELLLELMNNRLKAKGLSDRTRVEYLLGKPAVLTSIDSNIVQATIEEVERVTGVRPKIGTATYGTDCSVLQPKCNILNVICGPGSIKQAHQPNEYIRLHQMYQAVEIYLGIARRFDESSLY
jgi:succinyl-diaminopimelate desuccinylase